mmetsp:Transcript_11115/g.16900  ORF Transcript_11115/g.16900 Transcript_11115/m.16900 type:complete len:83 (+) Transcript_11115:428-676(+)
MKQQKRNLSKPESTTKTVGKSSTEKRNSIEITPQIFMEPKVIRKDPESEQTAGIDNSKFNDIATFRDASSPVQADREIILLN